MRAGGIHFGAACALAACGRSAPAPAPPDASASAPGRASEWESASHSASEFVAEADPASAPVPCGDLGCTQYSDPRAAFADAIASRPLVLALGEVHAPKGATVPSAAKRFTTDLLPLLAPVASDLLVELMLPPSGCAEAAAELRRSQAPVTARQAPGDQNEYVAMGDRAHALGLVPDALRPTCADMAAIGGAGDDAVSTELETIARLTREQGAALVARDARSEADRGKMVVIYGGALHNDWTPPPGAPPEAVRWSYAPALAEAAGGRFVAIDLIVPEFLSAEAAWPTAAWRRFYDRARLGSKTTLFRLDPKSFVLVFPERAPR